MAKKKTLEIELRVFDMATKEFNALDRSLRNIGKTVGQVSAIAVGALSTVGFVTYRMGKGFVEAASDVEGFEVRLTTALRSLDKAKELMSWITAFAASTPFEIPELVETSILLENVGMSAKDNLETIGNTAAAMEKYIRYGNGCYLHGEKSIEELRY